MELTEEKQLKKIVMHTHSDFEESKYRWVIIAIASGAMILNGLLNNLIIPIAHKLSVIYGQSEKIINLPTILSFLIFSLANIPINFLLDRKGIKVGFKMGLSLYLLGMLLVNLINVSFYFVALGYIIFSFGQPFILNTPAKIATYWFFPENRALATSILVGSGIIGSGMGFAIPTLAIHEDSIEQQAKKEIAALYFGYTLATGIFAIIAAIWMKSKPSVPPSNIAEKEQLSLQETFQNIKQDRNLWKFFAFYCLIYGSFQTFASSANLLIKPFGASDIDISIAAVLLIILGTVGAVLASLYLKKSRQYKRILRICCIGALTLILVLTFQLFTIQSVILMQILVGCLGFFLTPIVPISYQLGCELAFPIGQAQITGLLNGGSLIWAFVSDSLLTVIIGFGTKEKSFVFILALIAFISIGSFSFLLVKVDLKRKKFQEEREKENDSTRASSMSDKNEPEIEIPKQSIQQNQDKQETSHDNKVYQHLEEQAET